MNGEDWAILIIIAILAVILSSISKWWATLVFTLGFKIALLVVAMIIVILVASLIALMCASPGWFDRVFNMANNNLNKIAKSAIDNMGYLLNQAANTAGHAFAKLFVPILVIGAVFMFVGVRNGKNK